MTAIAQSPKDPAFVQDPYPFYERARALGEIVDWQDYGMAAALSHRAVNDILRSRDFARLPPAGMEGPLPWDDLPAFRRLEEASMLSNEAPRHPALRRAVVTAFTSRRVEAMGVRIAMQAEALIDRFPGGEFDLIPAYAEPIPVLVIAEMLGEDPGLARQMLDWSHAMVRLYTPGTDAATRAAAECAAAEFDAHMRASLSRKTADPEGDLAQALLVEAEAGRLSLDEVVGTCVLLLNAGHEATVQATGIGVATLLARGDGRALCAPGTVTATVEEILRHDPPLHVFTRYAQCDTEVAGRRFARGEEVACLLAAANRDPAVFPDPARFDPARQTKPLTSFGAGVHFCLGAPLARLEMQIGLATLFRRCPDLRLAAPPRFADTYHFHGLERLMVTA